MLGMSRDEVSTELEREPSLVVKKNSEDKGWNLARKNDGKEIIGLFWGEGDALLKIFLRPEFGEYLQGDSKRLVTLDVLDVKSAVARLYLGTPDKIVNETDPNVYAVSKWTMYRYCYHEKGIEFLFKDFPPKLGKKVDLILVK